MHSWWQFMWQHREEVGEQTAEHLWLVAVSMLIAIALGLTIGITLRFRQDWARPVMGGVSVVQTIPSLALLGILLPLVGIGALPAIIALFLYALLPIVRNTYTGLMEVPAPVLEAARGVGMSSWQQLWQVQLPLAVPTIYAGIRTAAVINVGTATLCALIAAGGLGEYIFRGISLNNANMIIAGAVPAALLALALDGFLALLQRFVKKPVQLVSLFVFILMLLLIIPAISSKSEEELVGGFPSEFMERADGYRGLKQTYGLEIEAREMEIGLMYEAIASGYVDLISGFSTDGKIPAYNLVRLRDDKQYFPPYDAAPLVREGLVNDRPALDTVFKWLNQRIPDTTMTRLNYYVDELGRSPAKAARIFLLEQGIELKEATGTDEVVIGSKNFTESYVLAQMFSILVQSLAGYPTEIKPGFGGTKFIFNALQLGEIDMYPEYTGTGLLVILPEEDRATHRVKDRERVFNYVHQKFKSRYGISWMPRLGFNNTFAVMISSGNSKKWGVRTLSELGVYSRQH